MIQLNLLPDVKLEYIKAQKTRSLVTGIAIVVTAVSIAILILMLIVDYAEKARISSLKSQINTDTTSLQSRPNINTILTVQNQLKSLTNLYATRPAATRLFTSYLNQVTPESVSLSDFSADFTLYTITLTGSANSLTTVNQYIDTLKLTTYNVGSGGQGSAAFSNVVLSSFGINPKATSPNQAASFTISLNFAPTIFDDSQNVTLNIPNITLSHAQSADTSGLFQPSSNTSTAGSK